MGRIIHVKELTYQINYYLIEESDPIFRISMKK